MEAKQNRLTISLVTLVLWFIILKAGEAILFPDITSLDELLTGRLNFALIIVGLFLLGVVFYYRWQRLVGLKQADPPSSWRLVWFPLLIILVFVSIAVVQGLPPGQVVFFILINSLLVGFEEELMFRGILFQGLLTRFNIWPAILLTSLLFGAVHASNGFITGDFAGAMVQVLQASLASIWFLALRLRTRSIYPAMLMHGLWDFSIFIAVKARSGGGEEATFMGQLMVAVMFILPVLLYGLWLLRGIGNKDKTEVLS